MPLRCNLLIKTCFPNPNAIKIEFSDLYLLPPGCVVCSGISCWEYCFENTNACSRPLGMAPGKEGGGLYCQSERNLKDEDRHSGALHWQASLQGLPQRPVAWSFSLVVLGWRIATPESHAKFMGSYFAGEGGEEEWGTLKEKWCIGWIHVWFLSKHPQHTVWGLDRLRQSQWYSSPGVEQVYLQNLRPSYELFIFENWLRK